MGSKFYTEIPQEDRDYKKFEDWVNLFREWEPRPPLYEIQKICMIPPGFEGPTPEEWKQIYEAYNIKIPRHR